jgi:hypothetical protein
MGCAHSKPDDANAVSSISVDKRTGTVIVHAEAAASEVSPPASLLPSFPRRISNKILPLIDGLSPSIASCAPQGASEQGSLQYAAPPPPATFPDGSQPACRASAAAAAGSDRQAPARWKKGEAIGSGSFGHVFVGLNRDTGARALLAARCWPPRSLHRARRERPGSVRPG